MTRPNVMVNGDVQPMGDADYAQWMIDTAPRDLVPTPTIPRLQFKSLLDGAVGVSKSETILTVPKFLLIYAGAENMDYADVFDTTDDGEPGYAKQLVAAGIVTQEESDAFEAAWPRS